MKDTKQKVLLTLEQHRTDAEQEMRRWNATVQQYEADLLFAAEQNFPPNLRTVSSRNLAKEEAGKAREARRLYTVAITAVKRA